MALAEYLKLNNIRTLLLTGGITEEDYLSIMPDIQRQNAKVFSAFAAICVCISGILLLLSAAGAMLTSSLWAYAGLFLASLAILVWGCLALNGVVGSSLLPFAALSAGFAYGISLGVTNSQDLPSVSFMVLLVALPLLVVDRPYKVIALIVAASAAMIGFTLAFKTGSAVSLDVVDTLSFAPLSIFANAILTRSQINEILSRSKAEKDRSTDALTGLRNSFAYHEAATILERKTISGEADEYGLIVADINFLKETNDRFGHDVGDQLIKACAKLLCDVFSHSPVMRIGGDEFVVILQGSDYDKRNQLMEQFHQRMNEARFEAQGLQHPLSVATGLDIYQPNGDMHFLDVFRHADTAMYHNKAAMKAALKDSCNY